MMRNNTWGILLLFLLLNLSLSAQTKKQQKADEYYNRFSFVKARELYKELSRDTTNHEAWKKLAECEYKLNNWVGSEEALSRVVTYKDLNPNFYLLYAHSLKSNGKLAESDAWMDRFYQASGGKDSRAVHYKNKQNDWKKVIQSKNVFSVAEANFNTDEADYAPAFYKDTNLVFASTRDTRFHLVKTVSSSNDHPFTDIYQINLNNDKTNGLGTPFALVNTNLHDGPICFDTSFTAMYVTRNKKAKEQKKGVNNLQLFKYTFHNNHWSAPELLSFNGEGYSVGHACMSPDNKKLFFVSDMPGGVGGSDIYYVDITRFGGYGPVTNAGKNINTEGDELFPFVDQKNVLYFASDGHPGLGRLDIFYSLPDYDNKYGQALNAGPPLNSDKDDFAIAFDKTGKNGFFSTNRPGRTLDDNIYVFSISQPISVPFIIQGVVTDQEHGTRLPNVDVVMFDSLGNIVHRTTTDTKGKYEYQSLQNHVVRIYLSAKDYVSQKIKIGKDTLRKEEFVIKQNIALEENSQRYLTVSVLDHYTETPLADVMVKWTNKANGKTKNFTTGKEGIIKIPLPLIKNENYQYELVLHKNLYMTNTVEVEKSHAQGDKQSVTISLTKPSIGLDIKNAIDLKPIYFDPGQYTIQDVAATELDKVVMIMKEFPKMKLDLRSHTDSKGSAEANQTLSERRALACAVYMKVKGISKDRITTKGFGESQLVNECKDLIECPEEEHAQNRRTEFIIRQF